MAEVIVIGGGPGGYVSAIRAAQLGNNVKLVEKDAIGGTCLNRGCIPTKVLLHAVGLRDNFKKARDYGFTIQEQSFDWETLMQRKNDTVKQLTDGVRTLLDSWGVEVIEGEAFFEEPKVVSVRDDRGSSHRLSGDYFIIATGSRPSTPPIEGLESRGVLTSDEALDIEEIPSSMLIVGGGVIGIEFATLFSGLGCNVTVVEFLPRILSTIDEEMAYMVHEILSSKGISIHVAARVAMVHRALEAAEELSKEGISVEVVDPRTLQPLDNETIIESIKKTHKVVIVHEAVKFAGPGAEIAAMIADEAFDYLDAPIKRVAAPFTPVPFSPVLEQEYIPSKKKIINAVKEVTA